jgi:hypothetical protein
MKRMSYNATLDWLINNDDLSDFIYRAHDPSVACLLAADTFGKTEQQLRVALQRRIDARHANKQRYGE